MEGEEQLGDGQAEVLLGAQDISGSLVPPPMSGVALGSLGAPGLGAQLLPAAPGNPGVFSWQQLVP